jgi:hypothetical protein
MPRPAESSLSRRERQILDIVSAGVLDRQRAARLSDGLRCIQSGPCREYGGVSQAGCR